MYVVRRAAPTTKQTAAHTPASSQTAAHTPASSRQDREHRTEPSTPMTAQCQSGTSRVLTSHTAPWTRTNAGTSTHIRVRTASMKGRHTRILKTIALESL